jgi:hypothetical protein
MSYNSLFGLGAHSPDASLLGHWNLQETTGTTASDSSGGGHDLTINGMGSNPVTASGPSGWLPSSFDFDGSNDYLSSASWNLGIGTGTFTLGAWIYPDTVSGYQIIFGKDVVSFRDLAFGYGNTASKLVWFSGTAVGESAAVVTASAWQHVSVVRSSTATNGITFYRNVTSCGNTTDANSHSISSALNIGRREYSGFPQYLNGRIAEPYVFSRELSTGELTETKDGPELNYVSGSSLSDAGVFDLGTWSLPSPFASGNNGSPTYEWVVVNAAGSVVDSGSGATSTGTADLSSEAGNVCYLLARVSNSGGHDLGDFATRTSGYGSSNDGYYELTSVTAASGGGPGLGSGTVNAVATITGAGVTTASGSGAINAVASLNAVGLASSVGQGSINAVALLAGQGVVVKSGFGSVNAIASLTGVGAVVQYGTGQIDAVASLAGVGLAPVVGAASGFGTINAVAALDGAGTVNKSGSGQVDAIGTIVGVGLAPSLGTAIGSGTITAIASMVGAGSSTRSGQGSINAVGSLAGVGYRESTGSGELNAVATIVGVGTGSTTPGWLYYYYLAS